MKRVNFWLILIGLVMALCCLAGSGLAAELIIPSSVNTIEAEAFYGNTSLDEVVLPEDIKALGDRTFAYSSVKKINLPASLTTFGVDVFLGVEGLQVTAEAGTPAYAWADKQGLIDHSSPVEDFVFTAIDDTTCKIVGYVGSGGAITLPTENADGLKVALVEEHAFDDHTEITEVTIPSGVGKINRSAFAGCSGIEKLYIGSGVELAPYAFRYLSGIKEVTLPVDIYTCLPFQYVTNVETIHYLKGETGVMPDFWTSSRSDIYYEGDYRGRLEYYSRATLKSVDFEEGITHIGNNAFNGATYALEQVKLPSTLLTIGDYAFSGQQNIKEMVLPEGLQTIGQGCFYKSAIESVTVPSSVDTIPKTCFSHCESLTTVNLPLSLALIEEGAFYRCKSLTAVPVFTDKYTTAIAANAFGYCTGLTELIIPDSITSLGSEVFSGCTNITKLYLPSGVSTSGTFRGLNSLKDVTIPVDIYTTWLFTDVTEVETIHYLKGETGVMPDWWTAERRDVYYEGDYRGRLEFFSASSLKSIYFEEGITRIGNYAFYGLNVYGGGYNFALQNIYLPTTLESIGKYAFNTLPNIKHIKIPDRCRQIGEGNFLNCGDLIVVIGRYNDAARLYCVNNLIPYAIGGPLEIKAYQGYGDWTNEAGEYEKRLYLLGSASGGLKPYTYRFTVTENGESTVTDWQDQCFAYLPLPSSTNFSIRAEVIDSEGNYACSDDIAGEEEQVSEKPMKTLMFEQFATLANNATDPMSLRGAIFNDGLPETQWLLNLAVDVFHADLSAFQTQANKQAYLFKAAFDAAADGNAITMANMEKMPSEVKLLIKGNAINDDLYIDGLEALANESGGSVDSYSQGLKKVLKDFKHGKIGSDDIRLSVEQMGIPSDMQKAVTQNIELMGIISTINKVYDYGTFAINSFNDVLNQIYLLNAMDMNQLEVIAYIYKDSDNFDTQVVGIRLMDIIQADTYEERVALVAGGSLGILALDKILDQFSLASTPVFKFIYAAVDYVTGAGNYSKYMSELQWACDALMSSHAGLTSLCSDFTESPTDYRFELLLDRYITYAELAATVEEAYVNVCKIDMDVLRPDYVTQAAQKASREAELYRRLAESLRKLKVLWNAKNYRGMIAQMMECTGIQEYLNNYAYNSNFGYDYHQQGGW